MNWRTLFFLSLASAWLVGCTPWVWPDQPASEEAHTQTLSAGTTLGQTMFAREAGLQGVDVFMWANTPVTGTLTLRLYAAGEVTQVLTETHLPLTGQIAPSFYRLTFAPLLDSHLRAYYFKLTWTGTDALQVGSANGEAYLDGALYINDVPTDDAQMAFRLAYDPVFTLLGVGREVAVWLGWLSVAGLILVAPGWAVTLWLWPGFRALRWPEKLGLAVGVSVSLYPVGLLWTHLLGLQIGPLYVWALSLGAAGWLGWQSYRARGAWRWPSFNAHGPELAFVGISLLVLGGRWWVVRNLALPMWGDAYQHTMIAQLLVDNHGLFDSWAPYAEMQTLTYHFGFHAVVAAFHWMTGMALPQATLWVGQLLNGLAVLALYPLVMQIGGTRWGGVVAVAVAGLLVPMPMTYVNWGRYTQLAGQVVLPAVAYLLWATMRADRDAARGLLGLSAVTLGGLALTHYRILIFALVFLLAIILVEGGRGRWRMLMVRVSVLGVGGGGLFAPWLYHLWDGKISLNFIRQLSTPAGDTPAWVQGYNAIGDLTMFLPTWVWLALPLCLGWGLWRRQIGLVLISLWWGLLMVAANPQWVQLSGVGILSNFAIWIAAYIPAGLVVGVAGGWLLERGAGRWKTPALLLVVLGVGLWGARQRTGDVNVTAHALATIPDVRAAQWLQAHTPLDAKFLINSFTAYGNSVAVGADGGWWLPLLAHRAATVPPLNYSVERGPRPDYSRSILALTRAVQAKGVADPTVLALLEEYGVTHVYLGQRQGRVNNPQPALSSAALLADPHFRVIYHQDRVWVFEFCGAAASCVAEAK